jgi:hypothetical protein
VPWTVTFTVDFLTNESCFRGSRVTKSRHLLLESSSTGRGVHGVVLRAPAPSDVHEQFLQ